MRTLLRFAALAAALIVLLTSCGPAPTYDTPRVFEHEGLSITLTEDFKRENAPDGFTGYFTSSDIIVMTTKESFETIKKAGYNENMTPEDYLEVIAERDERTMQSDDETGIEYFSFENSVTGGQSYFYVAAAVRGSDSFWLVQFACRKRDREKYERMFIDWAALVKAE